MRTIVIGGTRFIGRAVVAELVAHDHDVLLVHRGHHEPADLPRAEHLHIDRRELAAVRPELERFRPDAVIDMSAMTAEDAEAVLAAVPDDIRVLAVSSMDVYRAFDALWNGTVTDAVPLRENSPLRTGPPPDRGIVPPGYSYDPATADKVLVENVYRAHNATICRLPMVYGPHDYQRREEFILARVRAGRREIPIGSANFLWSRGHAADLAGAMRLAVEDEGSAGETFVLCEHECASIELWARQILEAAGSDAELVRVDDDALPVDLELTGHLSQHLVGDASKARRQLGWRHSPPADRVAESVTWHLAHPPETSQPRDWAADDAALETRR
jgi:nucleoside-diphosphate-sugar epimerase